MICLREDFFTSKKVKSLRLAFHGYEALMVYLILLEKSHGKPIPILYDTDDTMCEIRGMIPYRIDKNVLEDHIESLGICGLITINEDDHLIEFVDIPQLKWEE